MNDSVKIASLFEHGRAVRPTGKIEYYENSCNWLFIVYGGSVRYKDNENETDLTDGCLYVLPAGKRFSLLNPPQGGPDHFYALLSCSPPICDFVAVDLSDCEFLRDCAALINKYNAQNDITAVTALLEAALGYIMTKAPATDSIAKRVKSYIDETAPVFSMQSVCKKFHYSRRYLDMKFKETFGITVDKYGTDRKFAYILSEVMKKVPLETICKETDYSSAANLSRDFKKRFGMPPILYRKTLKE